MKRYSAQEVDLDLRIKWYNNTQIFIDIGLYTVRQLPDLVGRDYFEVTLLMWHRFPRLLSVLHLRLRKRGARYLRMNYCKHTAPLPCTSQEALIYVQAHSM
jgi:hypothetical protein